MLCFRQEIVGNTLRIGLLQTLVWIRICIIKTSGSASIEKQNTDPHQYPDKPFREGNSQLQNGNSPAFKNIPVSHSFVIECTIT
jgi:hypothetical protein